MNLLPPPLSLPLYLPPPPPPPVYTYKKKFADNMADSISITGRKNFETITYGNEKTDESAIKLNSSKDSSKMDESEIKILFSEYWNSEYPRFGEGQVGGGGGGEVERLQHALEDAEVANEEDKENKNGKGDEVKIGRAHV